MRRPRLAGCPLTVALDDADANVDPAHLMAVCAPDPLVMFVASLLLHEQAIAERIWHGTCASSWTLDVLATSCCRANPHVGTADHCSRCTAEARLADLLRRHSLLLELLEPPKTAATHLQCWV